MRIRHALYLMFLFASGAGAEKLKKVLILDFKNVDKNPNYQYLEASVTDAVRNNLKAKFDFREMPREDWQKLAAKNYFLWPEENFNRGFALNLGLIARQDIAVGGYYQAVLESRGPRRGTFVIKAHVFVLNIGKKSVVSEFDVVMPADASLFGAVETLATRVVKEAQAVLPNKGETSRYELDAGDVGPHEIGLLGGIGVLAQPAAFGDVYTSTTVLYAKDFSAATLAAGYYSYHDFFLPRMLLQIMGSVHFGSTDLSVAVDTKKIRATLFDAALAGHLGYEMRFWRLALTPFAGGGFALANIKLDYTTLTALPVTPSGEQRSSADLNISAPFLEGGLRFSIIIADRIFFNLYGLYRHSFYLDRTVGQVFGAAGVGFRL